MLVQHKANVSPTIDKYCAQAHRHMAQDNAIACLLNCYIREYAQPHNQVCLDDNNPDCPMAFTQGELAAHSKVRLIFPESNSVLILVADRISLLGRCRFISQPYLKKTGSSWQPLDSHALAKFMLKHLAIVTDSEFNHELLEQISNSVDVTQAFIQRAHGPYKPQTQAIDSCSGLIASEQSLLWGHAMHPAPKSRHGVAFDDMLTCSPEIGANFPLYWFKVDKSLVKQLYCSESMPLDMIDKLHSAAECLYPCHPWEVKTIMTQPLVQQAIEQGLLLPLGSLGHKVYPTSSVRTLYAPEINRFLKFSIHVRLTNCVRKNAWYELESAIGLSRLLIDLQQQAYFHCPKFTLMAEPAASTLDFSSLGEEASKTQIRTLTESFGILYRDGIDSELEKKYQPQMAGALFAWDVEGHSICQGLVTRLANQKGLGYDQMASLWFSAYLDTLLPGVFYYFFKQGIAFEPHLQNTLVGFSDGLPAFVWLRDLEGTKLLPNFWPREALTDLSDSAISSVYYSREQGWNRIAYCTLINNVSEAIFHLAAGDRKLELDLWHSLKQTIVQWQLVEGEQAELQGLLEGDDIPSKNNLTTRLLKQADKHSGYNRVPSPFSHLGQS
ncbi:IucA/IucC family protein [Shewanella sp. YLB-07]|uniref:IucA/IucC family protein n=1 Tax=Shewanella sp. YLB-07 TaxID=2601268 RepID=UPI001883BCE6|nr:IucA/IucC family protein [Shewanella sp. YLB-07]